MLNLSLCGPSDRALRLLCLGAHSDDIEIGCGGTILSLLSRYAKAEVRWIVFSSSEERAQEARTSAGAFLDRAREKLIVVKGHRDGFFPFNGAAIKDEFEELKREFDPDLIFTHYRDDRHQDHRMISDLTWNTFRDHLILEYEVPKYDGDFGSTNFFVHLEEVTAQQKVDLIVQCFPSQKEKHWFDEETFFAILRLRGVESHSPSKYAEGFYCRKLVVA